ncbi:transmembrane protein 8B isoform X2 [Ranitomeya variabilis]|uniref:transmembrane protein 8B isoform X2 n=1 Tax=Ranitomeya variabilis TaxID=490064 RepID=UPI00405786E2
MSRPVTSLDCRGGRGSGAPGRTMRPPGGESSGLRFPLLQIITAACLAATDGLFVTDYFTRTPRKLSPFRSVGSVELFHFHIPEDTVIAVWNLITFKEQGGTFGDHCPDRSVTVYFRPGAPPVINPLGAHFPRDTAVPGSFTLTLTWTLPNRTTGVFNITSPLPGDWFLAAHLPKDEGKITIKGLHDECQYLFQPQLIVQRAVAVPVLYPGYVTEQVLPPHNRSALYKVFVPQFTSGLRVQLLSCHIGQRSVESCPLLLKLRAKAPPLHNSSSQECSALMPCQLLVALPLWQHWYYVLVERAALSAAAVYFQLTAQLQDCSRPGLFRSSGSSLNMPQSFGAAGGLSSLDGLPAPGFSLSAVNMSWADPVPLRSCWPVRPTLRNELDTFSVHFYIFFGPNVAVPPDRPAVFSINLLPVLDSGGVLNMELRLNVTSAQGENMTIFGCLNHGVPLISGDYLSINCQSGGDSAVTSVLNSAFAPSCLRVSVNVARTDSANCCAPTTTCSLPASVEQFYHACDQPGIVVFCIMEYDVLQFCDFLGSLMSVWVTVISMARLQPIIKQVLYLLGAMLLSMALQLDRHGLWNLLGPSLFAVGIMAIAWTFRTIRRRHCYPPTWKRWLFYLCPGTLIASSAVALYAFVETEENYFYIHSIWHMLIAGSVGFLLPPRAKPDGRVAPLARRKGCGYQLCVNEQEELGLVDPGAVSINSICTS